MPPDTKNHEIENELRRKKKIKAIFHSTLSAHFYAHYIYKGFFLLYSIIHAGCPLDLKWIRYGTKYYGISWKKYNYNDAKDYCATHGGKLASIATEEGFSAVATSVGEC